MCSFKCKRQFILAILSCTFLRNLVILFKSLYIPSIEGINLKVWKTRYTNNDESKSKKYTNNDERKYHEN